MYPSSGSGQSANGDSGELTGGWQVPRLPSFAAPLARGSLVSPVVAVGVNGVTTLAGEGESGCSGGLGRYIRDSSNVGAGDCSRISNRGKNASVAATTEEVLPSKPSCNGTATVSVAALYCASQTRRVGQWGTCRPTEPRCATKIGLIGDALGVSC